MTEVMIKNEKFLLLPERCAFRESDSTLLVADLHFGKAEVFQAHGIAISSRVLDDDLARLTRALESSKAKRLVVIGDLIHAPSGLTKEVVEKIARWRAQNKSVVIDVVRGNHDRVRELPPSWEMTLHDEALSEPPFLYSHEPAKARGFHCWSGHIHPVVNLKGHGDQLRLPCFAIGAQQSLLPAFSALTGGFNLWQSRAEYRLFPIAENSVMEV